MEFLQELYKAVPYVIMFGIFVANIVIGGRLLWAFAKQKKRVQKE